MAIQGRGGGGNYSQPGTGYEVNRNKAASQQSKYNYRGPKTPAGSGVIPSGGGSVTISTGVQRGQVYESLGMDFGSEDMNSGFFSSYGQRNEEDEENGR